jgi:hypothetical protein
VVLEQQTELHPTEIMTDTGAYTDVVFGLPVGSTKVTAIYYGDSNIAKSSASVIQTVQQKKEYLRQCSLRPTGISDLHRQLM